MGISLMDFGSHDLFGEKLKMRRGRARKEVKWETGLKAGQRWTTQGHK